MIIFLHINKTAGTTFRSILENTFGASHCHTNQTKRAVFSQADFEFAQRVFPRLRSISGHNIVDPLRFTVADPFYMTFLREPVARVLSHYQDNVLRQRCKVPFTDALESFGHLNNWQVKLLAGEESLDKAKRVLERCDFTGLTERFDLSLHVLERLSPYPLNLTYKRRIVAKNDRIKNSLYEDSRMMERVQAHNRLDLELYAFAVDQVFPRLCLKAGIDPSAAVASYELAEAKHRPRYQMGRMYNKVFRQIYKLRRRMYYPTDADLAAYES